MFDIGVIGSGNMGEAIIRGLIQSKKVDPEKIVVSDVNQYRLDFIIDKYGIAGVNNNARLAKLSKIIFLAVKPKDIEKVAEEIKENLSEDKIVVSVLAGIKIEKLKNLLGENTKIVRVMPNTPAIVGEGAIGVAFDNNISEDEKELIIDLLKTLGEVFIVDESLLDAITGLSGSGPAYVFTFIDALAQGGVKNGLPYDTALKLAVQTVLGSAKLLKELDEHPAVLRDKVTSPAGTTIYGLHELEKKSFRDAVISAVDSATKRSKDLS